MSEIETIDVAEAQRLAASGALLVDVREQDEWDSGHAPGATLLPMSQLGARMGELPPEGDILVMCQAGGRSLRVTRALLDAGYHAINVEGGMNAWLDAGQPVVRDR